MGQGQVSDWKHIFPQDFRWGVATAAYQIEGAVHEDGRGLSIWDVFSQTAGNTHEGHTGDVACDHYHLYPQDVQLMKDLGLKNYRLSIAWPRLFPNGDSVVNEKGWDFYNRLIDSLQSAGIEPSVTLYHWDLPYALEQIGGWRNRDTVYRFEEYADNVFRRLGDRVKRFITINEPWCSAVLGHFAGMHAPGLKYDFEATVASAHHLLIAHGLAVRAYRQSGHHGEIGITLNLSPVYPAGASEEDRMAAMREDLFLNRWYLDPVLKGKYPDDFNVLPPAKAVLDKVLHTGDLDIISSRSDFLGVNYYSYRVVADDPKAPLLQTKDVTPRDRVTDMGWPIMGQGLTDLLVRLSKDYDSIPLYVTENGAAYPDPLENGSVHDGERISYLTEHIDGMAEALQQGVNLRGYYVWSLIDNFEWSYGYSKRFGIVHVNYDTLERIPKDSALWYRDLLAELQQ